METELQTLRREIDELRNENIALHNELVKQNKILFEQVISIGKELANQQNNLHQAILFFGGASIHDHLHKYLMRLAGEQTAEFIVDNMPKVKSFGNRNDYLRHVINQSDVSGGGVFGVRRLQGRQHKFHRGDVAGKNYLRLRQLRGIARRLAIRFA